MNERQESSQMDFKDHTQMRLLILTTIFQRLKKIKTVFQITFVLMKSPIFAA